MQKNKEQMVYLYGKNALTEALLAKPHCIKKVYLSAEARESSLIALLEKNKIPVLELGRKDATLTLGDTVAHQGVIAHLSSSALTDTYESFIETLSITADTSLALLQEIQDPHNVGAIIRSAAAFGVSGVLMPQHHQAPITGSVIKTSAGMAFRIPLVTVGNVNETMRDLKKRGFWTYGLAMNGTTNAHSEDFSKPSVFVFGNEGDGIRAKTLETCDFTLSIPMHPRCESLNVAVSAGIIFNEWSIQHPSAIAPTAYEK